MGKTPDIQERQADRPSSPAQSAARTGEANLPLAGRKRPVWLFKAALQVPLRVWVCLLAAIVMDTAVQLVWKQALLSVGDAAGTVQTVLNVIRHPLFWPLVALCLGQFFCWIFLLGNADLSYVMPITGLSYATVAACAAVLFHEHIGSMRMLGILLILVGVWLTSSTGHRTGGGLAKEPG